MDLINYTKSFDVEGYSSRLDKVKHKVKGIFKKDELSSEARKQALINYYKLHPEKLAEKGKKESERSLKRKLKIGGAENSSLDKAKKNFYKQYNSTRYKYIPIKAVKATPAVVAPVMSYGVLPAAGTLVNPALGATLMAAPTTLPIAAATSALTKPIEKGLIKGASKQNAKVGTAYDRYNKLEHSLDKVDSDQNKEASKLRKIQKLKDKYKKKLAKLEARYKG